MDSIASILDSLKSGTYDDMTNDELYGLVLENRYNVLLPNCLLLLVKIINFEDHGRRRLQDRGFTRVLQREERDMRDLRRNVERRCDEFLRSLRAAETPFQVERGGNGLFTSVGLNRSLLSLRPSTYFSGFHHNLRLSFLNLVTNLNGAYTYQGRDIYDIDRNELARAFRTTACHFEWALAQHVASTRIRVPEEDLAILSGLNSLKINNNPQQTSDAAYQESQIRTAPAPPRGPSSPYPQSSLLTPSRRLTEAITPSLPQTAASSSPPAVSRFGVVSPNRSRQAVSLTQYHYDRTCTECKQTGHSSRSCPKTQCYQCKHFKIEDGFIILHFHYTTIIKG
jgi:hypothetical protein